VLGVVSEVSDTGNEGVDGVEGAWKRGKGLIELPNKVRLRPLHLICLFQHNLSSIPQADRYYYDVN
jgi:hypothetical protein